MPISVCPTRSSLSCCAYPSFSLLFVFVTLWQFFLYPFEIIDLRCIKFSF
jgi:hypothetical protein